MIYLLKANNFVYDIFSFYKPTNAPVLQLFYPSYKINNCKQLVSFALPFLNTAKKQNGGVQ